MSQTPPPVKSLDLRTTKCPLNFVQTKLALEKLNPGDVLEIWILAESQSSLNIPQSIRKEGHEILDCRASEEDPAIQQILIQKCEKNAG